MTTILYVSGFFSLGSESTVETFLGGPQELLTQLGDSSTANPVAVPYDDWDFFGGAQDCANKIAAKIAALPVDERIVVCAHSYGAVGATLLLNTPSLIKHDPSLLTFVLMGNSLRLNNGYWAINHNYGAPGPVSTTFPVIDIARQFDKYADYPNLAASSYYWQAINNVFAGDSTLTPIHLSYQDIRLDQSHAETTIGAVRFLLYETDPMPNPSGLTRAQIESTYNRVVAAGW